MFKKYLIKHKPKTLMVFGALVRNKLWPKQEFRVRVLEYPNSKMLADIREFVNVPYKQKFTSKGLSLSYEQAKDLYDKLGGHVLPFMEERMTNETPAPASENPKES